MEKYAAPRSVIEALDAELVEMSAVNNADFVAELEVHRCLKKPKRETRK